MAELTLEAVVRLLDESATPGLSRAERWAEAAAEMARHGEYEAAFALLDEATNADPREVRVHQYLSNVHYLMGDPGSARAELVHALELEPSNALLQRNLEALERKRGGNTPIPGD